jgi:circadian clock protein KaiC
MITRESTGDPALDEILCGGIPTGSMTVIAGKPGSGKTILALQILFLAARAGKKCIYFTTLSEPAIRVLRYMQQFPFFDADLIDENVFFVDLGAAMRSGVDATMAVIGEHLDRHEPTFVAIDSYRAIGDLLRSPNTTRSFTYDLSVELVACNATTLLVGEYSSTELCTATELAIADGIIELGAFREELASIRGVEVVKMRGTDYLSGQHFYDITKDGLVFYPRVRATSGHGQTFSDERVSTGIPAFDAMLDGGLPRGSTTVIQGATGAGKTLLSLQFLMSGCENGEPGVFFTLEETVEQLRAHANAVGWDVRKYEKSGLLTIDYASPVELSTDRYLAGARRLLESTGARRAAFDSLSTLALGVPSERRFKELAYALAMHTREAGITVTMTMESEQLLGSAALSAHGVSFIADNLIQLRYVEIGRRLERAVSILKARGIKHESELAALEVTATGLRLVPDRFKDLRGVITGLPVRDG